MKSQNTFQLLAFLILFSFFTFSQPVYAASTGIFSSPDSIVVKLQETIEYFFAFQNTSRVTVLEKQAEKRLVAAQSYAEENKNEKVQNMLQNYQQIKEKQNSLLGNNNDEKILEMVAKKSIEQQKKIEIIKTKTDKNTKQKVIQVQEKVVNQVAKQVVEENGTEKATEFLNEVAHIWAPGTGPGGEAGVVYEGGGKLIYAPGTSPGGQGGVVVKGGEMKFATGASMDSPGADVKNVEVKTGGTVNDPVPVQNGPNYAPGTSGNSPGNSVDTGGGNTGKVDSGNTPDSKTWIDP